MIFPHKISIDRISPNYISGWCYHRIRKGDAVNLCIRYDNKAIAETVADHFREDIFELDMHPTGECGFEFILDPPLPFDTITSITLTLRNSTKPLVIIEPEGYRFGSSFTSFYERTRKLFTLQFRRTPLVLFMHIPQTAGTTFNTDLQSVLPRNKITPHIELEKPDRLSRLGRDKAVLSGHLRFGLFETYFYDQEYLLYTIIRDPYTHLHSHLNWMIKTALDNDDNYFKYSNPIIYRLGQKLAEIQLHSQANLKAFVEELGPLEAKFFDNLQTRYFCRNEIDRVSRNNLEEAISNLSAFQLVGLTEAYDSFLEAFIAQQGFKTRSTGRQLNRSSAAPLFDTADLNFRDTLYPLVQYDLILYNIIKRQWAENIAPIPVRR